MSRACLLACLGVVFFFEGKAGIFTPLLPLPSHPPLQISTDLKKNAKEMSKTIEQLSKLQS